VSDKLTEVQSEGRHQKKEGGANGHEDEDGALVVTLQAPHR
jgi:hypothetical protein